MAYPCVLLEASVDSAAFSNLFYIYLFCIFFFPHVEIKKSYIFYTEALKTAWLCDFVGVVLWKNLHLNLH